MRGENKKHAQRNFMREILSKTAFPTDMLDGEFRLEMHGRRELYIQGCRRIIKYSESKIVLSAKVFDVCICGEGLFCSSYHCSGVEISGFIESVSLLDY